LSVVCWKSAEWRRYSLFGQVLASDFPFCNRLAHESGEPDLTFTCVAHPPVEADLSGVIPSYANPSPAPGGRDGVYLYRLAGFDLLRFSAVADFYLFADRIVCHVLDPHSPDEVEALFLGTVLAFWLETRGIPVLHASALTDGKRTIAFLGERHGGKSALAASAVAAGYHLLTDDVLPLELRDRLVWGRPGYPTMRMWPNEAMHFVGSLESLERVHPGQSKRRVPVGEDGFGEFCARPRCITAIYLLNRSESSDEQVRIDPVRPAPGVVELVRASFTPRMALAAGLQPARMEFFSRVVERVPLRRLTYPSGLDKLALVRDTIVADLASRTHGTAYRPHKGSNLECGDSLGPEAWDRGRPPA
jgi:hypothetical protein